MKSWFKYYCQPQTLVGWLCWMCIRYNSTAASFPARTSSQCGCLAGHSTRSHMDPLLGQKSWVAKPAIILPLFWSLTFGNLASTTSPAVIIMCMHPLVSRRKKLKRWRNPSSLQSVQHHQAQYTIPDQWLNSQLFKRQIKTTCCIETEIKKNK